VETGHEGIDDREVAECSEEQHSREYEDPAPVLSALNSHDVGILDHAAVKSH
jgi:hypothetical protein